LRSCPIFSSSASVLDRHHFSPYIAYIEIKGDTMETFKEEIK
jgi:hypothetical protein